MTEVTTIASEFEGEKLASPWLPPRTGSAPAVLIFPTVMGVSDLEIGFARKLNDLGYGAMVADPFGVSTRGGDLKTMFGEMGRLKGDRAALRRRVVALLDLLRAQPGGRRQSDRGDGLLLWRAVRARPCAIGRRRSRGRQLPRTVRSAAARSPADHGQGRGLSWLGRPDGPARCGRRAGEGANRGRRRLADPRLWSHRPRLHQPARGGYWHRRGGIRPEGGAAQLGGIGGLSGRVV